MKREHLHWLFEENSNLYFEGIPFEITGKFTKEFANKTITLDYLLKAKLTTARENVLVDDINSRVLFVPKFSQGKSTFQRVSLG